MNIKIPTKINYILETFWQNGFEAYCVGGSIRDSVMGIATGDWDITTSALPEETKALFKTEKINLLMLHHQISQMKLLIAQI